MSADIQFVIWMIVAGAMSAYGWSILIGHLFFGKPSVKWTPYEQYLKQQKIKAAR